MSAAPPTTVERARERAIAGTARSLSGVAFTLGFLGLLNAGPDDLGSDSAEVLFVFLVHPLTALAWLAIGLVGIAMSSTPARARSFLVTTGVLLVGWAVLALAVGDAVTQALTRDTELVALNLLGGLLALVAVLAPLPAGVVRMLAPPAEEAEPPA